MKSNVCMNASVTLWSAFEPVPPLKYNVCFNIAAIMLGVMLILIITLRRTYQTKTCRLYKALLWFNLISSVADLISAFTISFPERCPLVLNYVLCGTYLIFHNATAMVFLLYVIALVRGNYGMKWERVFWVGTISMEVALIITSPFTKLVYYFDEDLNYCHGYMMYFLYAAAAAFMLYSIFLFLRYRKILNVYQMITNIVFLSVIMGSIVFQYFYPEVLIESFSSAIAMLMMNVALDDPAMYFYRSSYCFNQTAFDSTIALKLESREEFAVLGFTFDDLSVMKKKYGDATYDKMISQTIARCHKIAGQKNVYLLGDGCFAIDTDKDDIDGMIEKLGAVIGKDTDIGEKLITLTPHYCVFNHPGFAETVGDVNDAINNMLGEVYKKTGEKVIYNSSRLLDAKHRESQIIHALHFALRSDGFEVFYQPIRDRVTGRYISAEALVRLKKQGADYIGPDEFIPLAEKNGMILDIGELVFEKVCRFWHEAELDFLGLEYIEVNLSMMQLMSRPAVERLVNICTENGVDPSRVNFEITETVMADPNEKRTINASIEYLREKGFSFSLDDYGSGYATAPYLAEMSFNIVKIDKDILWNAMKNGQYKVVLASSISLTHEFGMQCVAEGVETNEMAEMLGEMNCDFFQGYLYSRPLKDEDLLEFIRNNQKKYHKNK